MLFEDALFDAIRRMDEEASGFREGVPIGLAWYGPHFRPECKKPPTETSWTRRLEQLLPTYGFPTQSEVRYPGQTRLKCDNVVTLADGSRLWLENKGAWKSYWIQCNREWIYRSYLLHPLVPGLDPKSHTVPLDLQKLYRLRKPEAGYIGLLLLGFDSTDAPMDEDVTELVRLSGLGKAPWEMKTTQWQDRLREASRVRIWFWKRPVLAESEATI